MRSRSSGKQVDVWYYEYRGISSSDEVDSDVEALKVQVRLLVYKKFTGDTPPLAAKEVWFEAVCDRPKFSIQGSDIEALRCAMWEHLDAHYAVKWEDYLLVEILPNGPYSGIGTGLSFGYETVYKGTAHDGSLLLKQYRYGRGDVIEPWPGEFRDRQGNVTACIPATQANRKALDEFARRIDLLRERLIDLVRPESIEHTLLTLSSLRLLPTSKATA